MDPVHILMDPVHGPGPRRGSMDQGSMFCTFPSNDGSQDDAIYDNEMPEVADDDSRLTVKKTTMTKNLNCMKFSQTKRLLYEPALK